MHLRQLRRQPSSSDFKYLSQFELSNLIPHSLIIALDPHLAAAVERDRIMEIEDTYSGMAMAWLDTLHAIRASQY